jgi:hypothetical protein
MTDIMDKARAVLEAADIFAGVETDSGRATGSIAVLLDYIDAFRSAGGLPAYDRAAGGQGGCPDYRDDGDGYGKCLSPTPPATGGQGDDDD